MAEFEGPVLRTTGAIGISTPLALERTPAGAPAELFSYHTDAAGSVVAITGPSGAVVAEYQYDAFGAVTAVAGSDPIAERNPLRYRAYYHDAATGLYYLPARSYDPATARFLSPDPAPPSAGDPLSLNRYTYCAGDPVNSSDPTGAVTDVEWGAWDHYYNHDPATKGDRTAAADRTSRTHAGVNTRRAEAAAREAEDRAAAMREREMQEGDGTIFAPLPMEDAAKEVVNATMGGDSTLLVFGLAQMWFGAGLMILGWNVGWAGVASIPVTAGLGSGLTIGGGAAMVGGAHLLAAGVACTAISLKSMDLW